MRKVSINKTIELFLTNLNDSASPGTRKWYASFLREFQAFAGERRLDSLTPSLLHSWIAARYGEQSESAQHGAGRAVCRLVNWAVDEGRLDKSPLRKFRNRAASHRERVLSGEEYARLLKESGRPMRQAIKFLWHTGCRPQELRAIEGRWIGDRKVVLPRVDSKGRRKRRVIYLDSLAAGVVTRLAEQWDTGPVFRDHRGVPWTRDSLCHAFGRVRDAAGLPDVCAYTLRHTWITRLLIRGVSVPAVAALAGNSPTMILRVYSHVAQDERHLRAHLD